MPPLDERTPKPIRDAAVAQEAAAKQAAEARRALDALESTGRQAAEYADARALADAQAAGKADPGPKHVKAHEQAVSAAKRQHDAAKLTQEDRAADLRTALDEYEYDWREALDEEDEELAQRYQALLDEAQDVAQRRTAIRARRGWLNDGRYKGAGVPHVYDRKEQRPAGELFDALRDLNGSPPQPRGLVYMGGR